MVDTNLQSKVLELSWMLDATRVKLIEDAVTAWGNSSEVPDKVWEQIYGGPCPICGASSWLRNK